MTVLRNVVGCFTEAAVLQPQCHFLKLDNCAGLSQSNLVHPSMQFGVPCRGGQQVSLKFYIQLPNYRKSHLKRQWSPTSVFLLFVLLAMMYGLCILPIHTKHSFSQWSCCMRVSYIFLLDLYITV